MSALPPTTDDTRIWDIWESIFTLPVVTVADELGIFKALSEETLTTQELATQLHLDARALAILLAGLCSQGLIDKRLGRWSATHETRRWLHPQAKAYWGAFFGGMSSWGIAPLHARLLEAMKSGKRPKDRSDAPPEWERPSMTAEGAAHVAAFMHAHSQAPARGTSVLGDFAAVASVMDVGCGSGVYGIELAKQNPHLQVGLMDLKEMCVEVDKYIAADGVGDRVKSLAVNMFHESWPTGYESHFFANVFHDWTIETNKLLAKKSFDALPSGGRIFLSEILMDDEGTGPWPAAAFSLLMLIGTLGKQYSVAEFQEILESAGFTDVRAKRSGGGYYSLVSARKP
jgi:3-hydroxy-5-methyl-1-naphthoate 3-O-methyltransferase